MTDDNTASLSPEDIQDGLYIARELIAAGIPVFAAPPCPGESCPRDGHSERTEFDLPKHWQKTVPSEVNLERWQLGWGLAAVGGHACDFLDIDPRNGGSESIAELARAGQMPRVFSTAVTPSGGVHHIISHTGERKGVVAPGLDLQAGDNEGIGRGFVWIAPTVKRSKDPEDAGARRPYRWVSPPALDEMAEWAGRDDSLDGLVLRLAARRAAPRERKPAPADPDDPFLTASTAGASRSAPEGRTFTVAQAREFVRPFLVEVQRAPVGVIEETANKAAAALSHFVPNFWTVEQAFSLLADALSHTAYDPNGPSDWRAEKFLPVLRGDRGRRIQDPWVALPVTEFDPSLFHPDSVPAAVAPPATAEEAMDLVDRLIAEMLTADQLAARPAPKPLIRGILDLDSEAWMIGKPGCRKSFVALDMARCVATGQGWQGYPVTPGLVVYIVAEGASGISMRVRALQEAHGPIGDGLLVLPRPVQASDPVAWEVLVAACRRLRPVLVVIDTQARVTVGMDENAAKEMGVYVEAVRRIREATEACVLTIHHTGRQGDHARGSTALDGAQGTELRIESTGEKSHLTGALIMDKQKDMAEGDGAGIPLRFEIIKMGEDLETGRELSSLVLAARDSYAAAQYVPEPWEGELAKGEVQQKILRVLRDQGRENGLTKAECRANVKERFGAPPTSSFATAWSRVLEMRDRSGDPIVDRVSGERYAVVSLELLNVQEVVPCNK